MQKESNCQSVPKTGTIDITSAEARARWAKAFGISETVLMKAVNLVGTSVKELRKLFCRDDQETSPQR